MTRVEKVRLTTTVKKGGCASKLSPSLLHQVLGKLPKQENPNVLVGFDHADDAGVYRIDENTAIVQTVDFFTPIVDDPATFGAVAAANALSDVYAMGGRPISALSITCFPEKSDLSVLEEIVRGGLAKIQEAGAVVLGGHSVADDELKYGYAITGLIDPKNIRTNAGARPGDDLVFTKRLGTGVISTALKKGIAAEEHVAEMIESVTQLNAAAGAAIARYRVSAATDVTGFGLMGHAREMALASEVGMEFDHMQLQFLPGALEYARQNCFPGGQKSNRDYAECAVEMAAGVPAEVEGLLYDPQTSGGLLIAVDPADTGALLAEIRQAGVPVAKVGRIVEREGARIQVG